jgi:hypothetical protein
MEPRFALVAFASMLAMPRLLVSMTSDIARTEVWKTALRVFTDNPLLGYGNGNFYLAFRRYENWDMIDAVKNANYVQAHAHNDILHVLATMGIVGFIAYALLGAALIILACGHKEKRFLLSLIAAYSVMSFFNPVTASVFIMLALVFGVASSKIEPLIQRRASLALASLAVALITARLTLADYHYALAGVAKNDPALSAMEFQRAAELNPWEMFYSCRQVDSLMRLIPHMPLDQRRPLAMAGRDLALTAVARHPMDSYAHELLGKQILIGYIAGYRDVSPREALKAFNRAQELAPTFELLMWRRRNTANQLGDLDEVSYADHDINNLRAVVAPGRKS